MSFYCLMRPHMLATVFASSASSPALVNWTGDGEQKAGLGFALGPTNNLSDALWPPSNASVDLDPGVCDAPLQEPESMPARLALEWKNVEEACQTFNTDPTDPFNVFARAPGTNRLRH